MILRRNFLLFIVSLLICIVPVSAFSLQPSNSPPLEKHASSGRYKEGELLVRFKREVRAEAKAGAHARLGSKVLKDFSHLRIQHVKLREGESVERALALYRSNPDVEVAEPNYIVSADLVPRDSDFGSLWGLNNTGQSGGTPDADIDAVEAWNITTGSTDVVVAVIDSGVDYSHPDLVANMWVNPGEKAGDGIDNDGNGYIDDVHGINAILGNGNPMDDHFHGTHVAGTIGAAGNNRRGVTGVNWNVKIMALRFLDSTARGLHSDAIECIEYVRMMKDRGVNIVATNNSWGNNGVEPPLSLYAAIAAQQDILFVAAAGNSGVDNAVDPHWPAAYDLPNIIAVAALDRKDQRTTWSNYGRTSVHLGAPGSEILSTIPGGGYESYAGTSMASPHVAGVAALLKAQDPTRDMKRIKNLLLTGGDDIAALNGMAVTGKRLNAYGSLTTTSTAVLAPLAYPQYPAVGTTHTLSALSLRGAETTGPVTVTSNGAQVAILLDNGVAPDRYAGDGIFSGTWTVQPGEALLTFSSDAGSQVVNVNTLVITGSKLHYATIGKPYSDYLRASGGKTTYAWSVVSGSLPPGLSLNTSTGEVSGVPAAAGKYPFTVQITDGQQTTSAVASIEADYDEVWFFDSGNDDRVTNMAADDAGNVYLSGQVYNGTNSDFQLVKFSSLGTVAWVRTYDGGGSDYGRGVAVDAAGNVYTTGRTQKGASVVALTLKYDPQGNLVWQRETDATGGSLYAESIALDSAGNIVIGGNGISGVLVKMDQSGNQLWSKQVGGQVDEITLDAADNIYIAGGSQTMKCDRFGNVIWTKPFTMGLGGEAYDVAADASGNVYVTGYYSPEQTKRDILTIKYDTFGNVLWSKTYATGGDYIGFGITVDVNGYSYVAGNVDTSSDRAYCLTLKYDPAGNLETTKVRDVGDYDYPSASFINSSGTLFVGGEVANRQADPEVLAFDMFVIKYADLELPVVTGFDLPATSNSTTVPVNIFTASDNMNVTGYLVTDSNVKPSSDDSRWSATPPASYAVAGDGTYTLYAWAKDGSGNVSVGSSDTVTVTYTVNSIAVTQATYAARTKTLTVYATSNYGANTALQVDGYGAMTWNAKYIRWEKIVSGMATAPATVTVSGPEGSSTANVVVK